MSNQQEEIFLTVIEQNKGIIYKIANSFKKDENDKKDLVQEIIFQLWRAFPSFDDRSKLSTWMYRVALNVAISSYRKEKKKNDVIVPLSESMMDFSEETESSPEAQINLLQQFINELKELDRALMLLYLEDLDASSIAEIVGISPGHVRVQIHRIKAILTRQFHQKGMS